MTLFQEKVSLWATRAFCLTWGEGKGLFFFLTLIFCLYLTLSLLLPKFSDGLTARVISLKESFSLCFKNDWSSCNSFLFFTIFQVILTSTKSCTPLTFSVDQQKNWRTRSINEIMKNQFVLWKDQPYVGLFEINRHFRISRNDATWRIRKREASLSVYVKKTPSLGLLTLIYVCSWAQ